MITDKNKLRQPPQILCVDDEPALRDVVALCLRRQGFEVHTAPDGLAAWETISVEPRRYDLVITDNCMPRMSGIDLVERLRADGFPGRIIVFSSTFTTQNEEHMERLRIDAVVEKGGPMVELLTAIRTVLESRV
jgi:CheY-like chemotaxis protein